MEAEKKGACTVITCEHWQDHRQTDRQTDRQHWDGVQPGVIISVRARNRKYSIEFHLCFFCFCLLNYLLGELVYQAITNRDRGAKRICIARARGRNGSVHFITHFTYITTKRGSTRGTATARAGSGNRQQRRCPHSLSRTTCKRQM